MARIKGQANGETKAKVRALKATGMRTKEVARQLGISPTTVALHMRYDLEAPRYEYRKQLAEADEMLARQARTIQELHEQLAKVTLERDRWAEHAADARQKLTKMTLERDALEQWRK